MQDLVDKLSALLLNKKMKLVTAESCTGGLLSTTITHKPGASDVFERGFITYSNDAKMELLGVSAETLDTYGAVSEQTAREMALGALENSKAQISVSITGIAGPDGGSAGKPVGLVYFGFAQKEGPANELKLIFGGNRTEVQTQATTTALKRLILILEEDQND